LDDCQFGYITKLDIKIFLEMEIGYLDGKDCKGKVKNHPIDDTHP
jgi:hypothetical protein